MNEKQHPLHPQAGTRPSLHRIAFETSRELDYFSEKELVAQTGHQRREWPLVVVKELIDNALDACEEVEVSPVIQIWTYPRLVGAGVGWLNGVGELGW